MTDDAGVLYFVAAVCGLLVVVLFLLVLLRVAGYLREIRDELRAAGAKPTAGGQRVVLPRAARGGPPTPPPAVAGALLVVGLGLALAGCCKPGAMRCAGMAADLCDARGRWQRVADCRKVQPASKRWQCVCSADPKRCSCRPGVTK